MFVVSFFFFGVSGVTTEIKSASEQCWKRSRTYKGWGHNWGKRTGYNLNYFCCFRRLFLFAFCRGTRVSCCLLPLCIFMVWYSPKIPTISSSNSWQDYWVVAMATGKELDLQSSWDQSQLPASSSWAVRVLLVQWPCTGGLSLSC